MSNRRIVEIHTQTAARGRTSRNPRGSPDQPRRMVEGWMVFAFAALLAATEGPSVRAAGLLTYNGSTGGISFGVTDYGGGAQITPKWIGNNFTGLNDVLASPGGTFQLGNPVIGNNLYETGIQNFNTLFLSAAGGGNGHGPFGAGDGTIYGPLAAFALTDATAGGGGSASYGIESWVSNYTLNQAYVGTFGSFLSIGGSLPVIGSSAIAAMQTEVKLTAPGGAVQNFVFDPLILAMGNAGGGTYSYVARGGAGAAYVFNPFSSTFSMLAVDSYAANLAAGTTIQVTSTITIYADPASIYLSDPDPFLLADISGGLPGLILSGTEVPEPGSAILASLATLILATVGGARRAARRTI